MPDRIDKAVDRIDRAAAHQRRIEAIAVGVAVVVMVIFQIGNRVSFLGAQRRANHDAAVQRKGFDAKLDEQGRKLDDANRRVGQLEEALKAAGLPVPDETPPVPGSSTTTTTVPRTTTTFLGRPVATTTTTRPPQSTTTTSSPSTTTTQPPTPTTTCVTLVPASVCH